MVTHRKNWPASGSYSARPPYQRAQRSSRPGLLLFRMVPRANTRCSPKPQGGPASSPLEARIVSSKPKSLFFRGRAFEDVDRGLSSCTDTNGLHCLTYQWLTLPNIPMAMAYTAADVLSMLYPYHLTSTYQPNNYSPTYLLTFTQVITVHTLNWRTSWQTAGSAVIRFRSWEFISQPKVFFNTRQTPPLLIEYTQFTYKLHSWKGRMLPLRTIANDSVSSFSLS